MIRRGQDNRPTSWNRRVHWWRPQRRSWWRADEGQVTAFVVVLTIGILALAGLTLDGGLAGSVSGGTMTNRFTAVPEPATFFVTGMSLVLAAACASLLGRKGGNHDEV